MTASLKSMVGAAASLALASALSPLAAAQSRDTVERRNAEADRLAAEEARSRAGWELRALERSKGVATKREPRLAYAQIREDYKQIQVVNNRLALSLSSGEPDLKEVVKSVSEIRRRAVRLRENLSLPGAKRPPEPARPGAVQDAGQLRSSLSLLDGLILEFVKNPIFKRYGTVDVEMSAKAGADLEEIIEVTERVKKGCEKLKKIAGKAQ